VNTTGFKFAMEVDENGKAGDGLGCDLCGSDSTNVKGDASLYLFLAGV
jgi:hypothetical protein